MNWNDGITKHSTANKSNSTTGAVQVEANLQEELSVHLHFTKLKCCYKRHVLKHVKVIFTCCANSHHFQDIKISDFLHWKSRSRSLGVTFAVVSLVGKFAAVNFIISHTKNINDILKLNLLPILKYACESLLLNPNSLDGLNVYWNNVFRKVFKKTRWESVKIVQFSCGRLDFIYIHHFEKLSSLQNDYRLRWLFR